MDAKDPDKAWPEFAQFDCIACHHDLKADSWRQKRGYTGKPGRPTPRVWPNALVAPALDSVVRNDKAESPHRDFQEKMKAVTAAFDAQPFGDPKAVAAAARQAAQWADAQLKDIKAADFDRAAAQRVLLSIGKHAKSRLPDFDSARQLGWAFRTIGREWDPKWFANSENAKSFKELDEQLKLDLPKGQTEIVKDYLKDALEKLNAYEPEAFQRGIDRLVQSLPKKNGK
jgi:hypothetical protein